jgi:hypothetical protein
VSEQKLTAKFPTTLAALSGPRRRNSHIFERAAHDLYIEPSWCSARLFDVETFPEPVWDCCEGTGTIVRSAHAAGLDAFGSDLSTGCDFLSIEPVPRPQVFSIVTNLPYGIAREIVEHALALSAIKVAFLFPTARVHAAHWLEQLPVAHQYFLQPRPSVPPIHAKKKGGGRVDFSWIVIDRRHKGPPTWGWLHRDNSNL